MRLPRRGGAAWAAALLVGAGLLAPLSRAADPSSLYGKWLEKFPNGNGMVTEFSASTIAHYAVDPTGKPTEAPRKDEITYIDLDPGTVRINFKGGGALVVLVKDAQTIVLDSAGMGTHRLVRMAP